MTLKQYYEDLFVGLVSNLFAAGIIWLFVSATTSFGRHPILNVWAGWGIAQGITFPATALSGVASEEREKPIPMLAGYLNGVSTIAAIVLTVIHYT